jgi:hypothetical protein
LAVACNAAWWPTAPAEKKSEPETNLKNRIPMSRLHIHESLLLLLVALLGGCRLSKSEEKPPIPLSQKVAWGGQVATEYFSAPAIGSDTANPGNPIRLHTFKFTGLDTVQLQLAEYRNPYWAFASFQNASNAWELAEGFHRDRDALIFHHGAFTGTLKYASAGLVPAEFLKEKLSFQGEELFAKPMEFAAFPLLGRIANSERVIAEHFLGREWQGPVFSVSYRCHGDTSIAFRAFGQNFQEVQSWMNEWSGKRDTLNWGREIHFQGLDEFQRPLIFWVFSEGVMGFTGCFDSALAQEYALKMEKTAVLWPKP